MVTVVCVLSPHLCRTSVQRDPGSVITMLLRHRENCLWAMT